MLDFMAELKNRFGYTTKTLNLGGGYGVRYIESDPAEADIAEFIRQTAECIKIGCAQRGLEMPAVLLEPGRSIVADAGMTIYSVGSVKTITGYRSYVIVDGGMTDNPRYALYKSQYTVLNASRPEAEADFLCTVAGRCCESGDLIQEDVLLARPERGELLAVCVTGAYNYAMSSNYNRLGRPPIVMISDGQDRLVVRRETFEDIAACDL